MTSKTTETEECMTVGELRKQLESLPAEMPIALEIVGKSQPGEDDEHFSSAFADHGEVEDQEDNAGKCFFITGFSDSDE